MSAQLRIFLINHFSNYMTELFFGPKVVKARYVANFFKGTTFIFICLLMVFFKNFSVKAFVYLGLHGSYGFLWILKDLVFPDKAFDKKMTICSTIGGLGIMSLYWFLDILAISDKNELSNFKLILAIFMYVFGVNLMLLADCQKFYTLKYKEGLITEGLFKRSRNPNYLGEMLLYGSFAVIIDKVLAWSILIFIWLTVFNLNTCLKDWTSLEKKRGGKNMSEEVAECYLNCSMKEIGRILLFTQLF